MLPYLLLLLSILLTVSKSAIYNLFAKRSAPSLSVTFLFNTVAYGSAAAIAVLAVILGGKASLSLSTALCALLYAVIVLSLQTVSIAAMRVGAMATTSICVMYGMIIPSLAGPIFWREPFGILQGAGILLMVISLWLLTDRSSGGSATKKWWLLAVPAFLLSGMAGLAEKIHQSTNGREEKPVFVLVACLLMALISAVAATVTGKREHTKSPLRAVLSTASPAGIVIGVYSIVNLTLAGTLNSMIYYPVANGGAMILTVIVSMVCFKEATDRRKLTGIALGLVGILCLSLPV